MERVQQAKTHISFCENTWYHRIKNIFNILNCSLLPVLFSGELGAQSKPQEYLCSLTIEFTVSLKLKQEFKDPGEEFYFREIHGKNSHGIIEILAASNYVQTGRKELSL